jgi:hypothetical protein
MNIGLIANGLVICFFIMVATLNVPGDFLFGGAIEN